MVEVACDVVALRAVKFCSVVEALARMLAKDAVPVKVGPLENTATPPPALPVSSLRRPAKSADVWILVLER